MRAGCAACSSSAGLLGLTGGACAAAPPPARASSLARRLLLQVVGASLVCLVVGAMTTLLVMRGRVNQQKQREKERAQEQKQLKALMWVQLGGLVGAGLALECWADDDERCIRRRPFQPQCPAPSALFVERGAGAEAATGAGEQLAGLVPCAARLPRLVLPAGYAGRGGVGWRAPVAAPHPPTPHPTPAGTRW
jgi:hypothetical protein